MKATLQADGSLILIGDGQTRIIDPSHASYGELTKLYHQHPAARGRVALSAAHAPAGFTEANPYVVAGHGFAGGQFIPAAIVAEATPAQKADLHQPGTNQRQPAPTSTQPSAQPAGSDVPQDGYQTPPGYGGHPWAGGTPEYDKVYNAPLAELHRDPERFQFKQSTNAKGVTDRFAGVRYDPKYVGVLAVWRDPQNGKSYGVNGHHRFEMAERGEERPGDVETIPVRYIDAKDAQEARAEGAIVNMAGDRGTAVDAAKFMRETGLTVEDIKARNISLKGDVAANGVILTKLNDHLFKKILNGDMPQETAIAIAKHLPDHNLQDQLASFLDKKENEGKTYTPKVIEDMAKEMAATPTHKTTERTLFGDLESEDSLFGERNELKGAVRANLAKAVNDFRAVSSERRSGVIGSAGNVLNVEANKEIANKHAQTLGVFDALVNSKGPITDAINAGAAEYAKATDKKAKDAARKNTIEAVRAAVESEQIHPGAMASNIPAGQDAPGRGGAGEPGAGAGLGEREGAKPDGVGVEDPRIDPGADEGVGDGGRPDVEQDGVMEPETSPKASLKEMTDAAKAFQFLAVKEEPEDSAGRAKVREHQGHANKAALDKWLMQRFGIDASEARSVSNKIGEEQAPWYTSNGHVMWRGANEGQPEPTGEGMDLPWRSGASQPAANPPEVQKQIDELIANGISPEDAAQFAKGEAPAENKTANPLLNKPPSEMTDAELKAIGDEQFALLEKHQAAKQHDIDIVRRSKQKFQTTAAEKRLAEYVRMEDEEARPYAPYLAEKSRRYKERGLAEIEKRRIAESEPVSKSTESVPAELPAGWEIKPAGDSLGLFRDGRETPVAKAETKEELTSKVTGAKPAISHENAPKSKGHIAFVGKHEFYTGGDGKVYKATIGGKISAKTGNRAGNLSSAGEMEKAKAKDVQKAVVPKNDVAPGGAGTGGIHGDVQGRDVGAGEGGSATETPQAAEVNSEAPDDVPAEAKPKEPGFTGETIDSLGRKYHWKDGKRVASEEPPHDEAASTSQVNPHISLAEHFADRLRKGEKIEAKELFEAADKHHAGTRAEGRYGPSDAYDSLEAGFNMALRGKTDPGADLGFAIAQVEDLADDVAKLPTQTNRSGNKDSFQQFGTPPHYAFAVNWLANLTDQDTVLEPSAGNGNLAVHAANAGAKVVTNEKDPRRAAFLEHQFGPGSSHQEDGEQIGAILPDRGVHPTAVVMNPPFSQTAGRLGDKKELMTGANHISEALQALEPGGRLVAIVGRGMRPESQTYRKWFSDLAEKGFTLRANVGVEGDEYKKYGTQFGTRTLIIDKVAPDDNTPSAVTGDAEDIPDLMRKLEEVRNDRPIPEYRSNLGEPSGKPVGLELPATDEGTARSQGDAASGSSGELAEQPAGAGIQWQEQLPGGPQDGSQPVDGGAASVGGVVAPERSGSVPDGHGADAGSGIAERSSEPIAGVDAVKPKRRRGGKAAGGQPGNQPRPAIAGLRPAEPVTFLPTHQAEDRPETPGERSGGEPVSNADLGQSLYEPYRPQLLRVDGAVVHDTPLVESAAMAAVTPPVPTYRPHLSPDIIQKKTVEMTMPDGSKQKRTIGLSEHAVEAVVYAGQAHEQFLEPDNDGVVARRGFFVGDGTGSGKGREIAGVMMDNTNQGRKKHVWISQSQDLIGAAKRDWADMGGSPDDVFGFDKVRDSATPPSDGIAYVTYAELRGGPKDKSAPRNVDNLAAWLGPEFDGVISFDEAHNLGNATDSEGGFGTQGASQQALAGIKLQKLCPKARVVYVSATGATEVKNLAYAERLGIWGRGTPFANKKDFIDQMEKGGVGAMEAVAQSLKATGSYTARSIGYSDGTGREGGKVDFQPVVHHLTDEQRFNYDAVCDAWQNVLGNIDKAIEITTGGSKHGGRARASAMSQFWGQQQRFYNQFMTSMQTPSVIAEMEKDKAEGRAPVVALVNTMKASLDRALAKKGPEDELDDMDVSPKEILTNYLKKSFPTERMEEFEDPDGNVQMRPVMTTKMGDDGKPVMGADNKPVMTSVEDPDAVALRDDMLEKIDLLRIPHSPLDMILNHFGHGSVAEVTGRNLRVTPNDEGKPVIEKRNKHTNAAERSAFMGGKKFAAVVSGAGLTGLDYHADKGVENQGRRRMYLLQPGWRADGAVQAFGRVNRTNQTTFPIYSTVQIAELQGQKRFISTIARRLEQLGALTKGQQQTGGSGVFSAADNLESVQSRQAMDHFFDDLAAGKVEDLDHRDVMKQLGLYSETQAAKGKDAPQAPSSMGQFLNRLLAMRIDTQNKVFNAYDKYLQDTIEHAIQDGSIDTGVENFKADSIAKTSDEPVYREPHSGAEVRHLTTIAKQKAVKRAWDANEKGEPPLKFVRNARSGQVWAVYKALDWTNPATGSVIPQFRLRGVNSSTLVPQGDLMRWQGKYEDVDHADAKADWEQQYKDTPEHTESEEHFLVGALLPVWDRIPGQKPKIYRIRTEDGQTVVGRHVPAKLVPTMLKSLGVNPITRTQTGQHDPALVHAKLEGGRVQATLSNGWKLKPVRVQGERRIELTGPGGFHLKEIQADGIIKEKIGSDTRFFVPVGASGSEVLQRITKSRPISDLTDLEGKPVSLSAAAGSPEVSREVREEAIRALRAMFPLSDYSEVD